MVAVVDDVVVEMGAVIGRDLEAGRGGDDRGDGAAVVGIDGPVGQAAVR